MPETTELSESLIGHFKQTLASWAASGAMSRAIQYDLSNGEALPEALKQHIATWGGNGDDDLPAIKIVGKEELNGHLGAFAPATKTIYLNSSLLDAPLTAEVVLTHEFGHYLVDKFFERNVESNINRFVGALNPSAYGVFDALKHADTSGSKTISLPNGETLSAEFFDTALHNSLDGNLFAFLALSAKDPISQGQNNCDDPVPSNRLGLQYRSAAHFDNNDINGGLNMVRTWYEDALDNFNATNINESQWNYVQNSSKSSLKDPLKSIVSSVLPDPNDPNFKSGKVNPAFTGVNAGLELLLYRFGQINHALQDFYTHSNWTTLIGAANTGRPFKEDTILESGLGLPTTISGDGIILGNQPGIGGTRKVMLTASTRDKPEEKLREVVKLPYQSGEGTSLAQRIVDFSKLLLDPLFGKNGDTLAAQQSVFGITAQSIYWRVDSSHIKTSEIPALKDPTLKATLKTGQDIWGLATGSTWNLLYQDPDYSVPLIDKSRVGITTDRALYWGFEHGGMAGTQNMLLPDPYAFFNPKKKYNTHLGPLARDSEKVPGHDEAKYYAVLQTRHEWDRLGNLIRDRYGEAGLDRFAKFALNPEYQQKYVDTYKVAGGQWTDWPPINRPDFSKSYFSADYQSNGDELTPVDLRFINNVFYDSQLKIFTSRLQLQYSPVDDGIDGNWIDSANTDAYFKIDRHGDGLTNDILKQIMVPKANSQTDQEGRSWWTEDNNDDNSDGFGTIFYVESRNQTVPISISSFNLGIDKIVLVDNNGKKLSSIGDHWGQQEYKKGSREALDNYNININAAPFASKINPVWLITKDQLAKLNGKNKSLSFSASAIFHDIDTSISPDQKLSFTGLESNAPFVKLVDGKLVANGDISQYGNQEFSAKVFVTDGSGGTSEDTLRIVVEPSLKLAGSYPIRPGQYFDVKFNKQDSQITSIYAAIDINDGSSDVESFKIIASVPGPINGKPSGFNPLSQRAKIGDASDSGTVKFYVENSQTNGPIELKVSKGARGSFDLRNGSETMATLVPVAAKLVQGSIPFEVNRFSLINTTGTVAGFRTEAAVKKGIVLDYSTYKSSANASKIGFYLTDVHYGSIVDPVTGHRISPDVKQLSSQIDQYKIFESNIAANNSVGHAAFKLNPSISVKDVVFTPYIKTSSGNTTYVYGCDAALNPDGFDHIAKIGEGLFGIEETYGGGDKGYNDILFKFNGIRAL